MDTKTHTESNASTVTREEVLQATQAVTNRFGDEYFAKLDKEEAFPHDYIKALMDAKLHDFKNLKTTGVPDENGDKAFDEEELPPKWALH